MPAPTSYRPRCPGEKSGGGKCFQHLRRAEKSLPAYRNKTLVPDWGTPPNPAGIGPYMRIKPGGICGYPNADDPPSGPWPFNLRPPASGAIACPSDPTRDFIVAGNCYHRLACPGDTPCTSDVGKCRKRGMKVKQSWVHWYGDLPFLSTDRSNCTSFDPTRWPADWGLYYWPGGPGAGLSPPAPIPEQTKYLTADMEGRVDVTVTDPVNGNSHDYATCCRHKSVNKLSGVLTYTGSDDHSAGNPLFQNIEIRSLAGAWATACEGCLGVASNPVQPDPAAPYGPPPSTVQACISAFYNSNYGRQGYTYTIERSNPGSWFNYQMRGHGRVLNNGLVVLQYSDVIDVSLPGTFTSTSIFTNRDPNYTITITVIQSLNISMTGYDWEFSYSNVRTGSEPISTVVTGYSRCTLSNAFGASELFDLAVSLQALWDLADDKTYPFRTDNCVTVAPQVHYACWPGPRGPLSEPGFAMNTMDPLADPNSSSYLWPSPGAVIGAPALAGSMDGHFDWDHVTYHCCSGLGLDVMGYGAQSAQVLAGGDTTDGFVPPTATCWTGNSECGGYYPQTFSLYDQSIKRFVLQVSAIIRTPRPSLNYARPCGVDRFALDPATISTDDWSGTTPADGYYVIITEGGAEYWKVASGAKTDLGPCPRPIFYDAAWTTPLCAAPVPNVWGKTKWPNAWALPGRAPITSAVPSGGNTILTLGAVQNRIGAWPGADAATGQAHLYSGDLVDVQTSDPLAGPLASALAITVNTDGTYTIPGSLSLGGTTSYLVSHGAPAWWWFDDAPKGEFIRAEWVYDLRSVVVDPAVRSGLPGSYGLPATVCNYAAYDHCLPWDPCNPQVMAFSGNYNPKDAHPLDHFPNGLMSSPRPCIADDIFGGLWQGAFFDNVDDPLAALVRPPASIGWGGGIGLVEDNPEPAPAGNGCTPDESGGSGDTLQFYYPHRPLVEPRLGVPAPWIARDVKPDFQEHSGVCITALSLGQMDPVASQDQDLAGSDQAIASAPATPAPAGSGIVFQPPPLVGTGQGTCPDAGDSMIYPNDVATSWSLAMNQEACVCGAGTFAAVYQANLVPCTTPDRGPTS